MLNACIEWQCFGFAITVCQFAVYDSRYCFAIFRDFRNFRAIGGTRTLRSYTGWWWWTLWCARWRPWQWISTIFDFKFHIKHFDFVIFYGSFVILLTVQLKFTQFNFFRFFFVEICPMWFFHVISLINWIVRRFGCVSLSIRSNFIWMSVVKLKCKSIMAIVVVLMSSILWGKKMCGE